MAYISVFDYRAGFSCLHQLDVRFKLVVLVLLNLAVGSAGVGGLVILSVLILIILAHLKISLTVLLSELRLFFLLLLFVFISRAISETGNQLISVWQVKITVEGVITGALVCCRLFHIVLLGMLFMRTSRPLEIKAAIYRLMSWIPGFPVHRVSLMISLMFRFIPMILELNAEISEAQQVRAVGLRRNPIYRLRVQVVPLMQNAFRKADDITLAMEARCYSDDRTDPDFFSGRLDWMVLLGTVLLTLFLMTC